MEIEQTFPKVTETHERFDINLFYTDTLTEDNQPGITNLHIAVIDRLTGKCVQEYVSLADSAIPKEELDTQKMMNDMHYKVKRLISRGVI